MIHPRKPVPRIDPKRAWSAAILMGLGLGLVSLSCTSPVDRGAVVGTSLPPLARLVEMVTGGRLEVRSLLPTGRSPHDYEPTPSELGSLQDAVLFVSVGGGVDGWMDRAARAVAGPGVTILSMSDLAPAGLEPHLWLDLDVVIAFLPRLAEALAALDPEDADGYRRRSQIALEEIRDFDDRTRQTLEPVASVPFALLHPAFRSLVLRYGLNPTAVLQIHTEGEARPRHLGNAARKLRSSGARVVFAEPQLSQSLAETMAAEIGGRVAVLDPLGTAGYGEDEGYLDLLRWNVRQLAEALDVTAD